MTSKFWIGAAGLAALAVYFRRSEDQKSERFSRGRVLTSIENSGSDRFPALSGYHPAGALWTIWQRKNGNYLEAKIKVKSPAGKWQEWKFLREGEGLTGIPYFEGYSQKSAKKKFPNTENRIEAVQAVKEALNAIGTLSRDWDREGEKYTISGLANISIPLVTTGAESFGWEFPAFGQPLLINEIEAEQSGELLDPR